MKDAVLWITLAIVIALALGFSLNSSIHNQTEVYRRETEVQISTSRALACTLVLPIGPTGRNPEEAANCWTQEGLRPPPIP